MKNNIKCIFENNFAKVDEFLSNNFSSPTHWKEWNLVISKHFNTEFFYYSLVEGDKLIGICPVHKIKNKFNYRLISGPKEYYIPFGGWIFSETTKFDSKVLNLKKNESLEIFSLPLLSEFKVIYEGYKLLKLYYTSIINLEKSEDEIWNSLPPQRRNKIRKAKKYDTEILNINEIGIDSFYEFYALTNMQYGLSNLSKDFFIELFNSAKNIKFDILIAKYKSQILGFVVLVSDKTYSIYWLGARLEEAPNIGYFDLLQWEMIKTAKSLGCKYYDLCYLEKDRLPSIYKFKSDYSNEKYNILNINYKPFIYRIINKFQKIF
jgi:lipid II:glycine glycyltransferase (peptidoglycan interpeptide bridge formation enzyme)